MHINIQIPEKSSNKVDRRSPAPVEETTILKSEQNHGDILPCSTGGDVIAVSPEGLVSEPQSSI